jgi:hypothetical protein
VAGVIVAAFAAFLTYQVVVSAAIFPGPQDVPSALGSAPSPRYAAIAEHARILARAAVVNQDLQP